MPALKKGLYLCKYLITSTLRTTTPFPPFLLNFQPSPEQNCSIRCDFCKYTDQYNPTDNITSVQADNVSMPCSRANLASSKFSVPGLKMMR